MWCCRWKVTASDEDVHNEVVEVADSEASQETQEQRCRSSIGTVVDCSRDHFGVLLRQWSEARAVVSRGLSFVTWLSKWKIKSLDERLGSASSADLAVPQTRLQTVGDRARLRNDLYCVEWGVKLYSLTHSLGDRAFCVAAENTWNILPSEVTSSVTLATFKHKLKIYLFSLSFPDM